MISEKSKEILIYIKTIEDRFQLSINNDCKISELKNIISEQRGVESNKMMLILNGNSLKDASSLQENKVIEKTHLIMLMKKDKEQKLLFPKDQLSKMFENLTQQYPVNVEPPKLPEIKQEDITMLLEMGFEESVCKKALYLNNLDPQKAMEWIIDHHGDPNLRTPLSREMIRELAIQYSKKPSQGIEECIKSGKCTKSLSGTTHMYQNWYQCFTCNIENNEGVCETCAKKCHAGHQLSDPNFGKFYCDCGDHKKCKLFK
eukprot:TRINITY_DN2666_c0_g1_i1.p1 TRINITY_DN2666_c0_g1~~TRINITY_DN2666_c0_g1_i1.p1  ORF type:complete len:259 (-),score=69.79 TRINITY_DN2666_c0_g1_i1:29-805(-)